MRLAFKASGRTICVLRVRDRVRRWTRISRSVPKNAQGNADPPGLLVHEIPVAMPTSL